MKKYEVVSPYVVFSVKDGAARKEYALKKGDTVELPENRGSRYGRPSTNQRGCGDDYRAGCR